jgi:hypothetical protein
MWWDIIKNQQQVSRGMINLDWEEDIEEEEEDCIKRWNAQCKKNESFSHIVKDYLIEDDTGGWETDVKENKITFYKQGDRKKPTWTYPGSNATYRISIAWEYLDKNSSEERVCRMLESFNKIPLGQGAVNVVHDDDIIGMVDKTNSRFLLGRTMVLMERNVPLKFCSIVITTEKKDKDGYTDENDEQNKKLEELAERARAVFNVV